MKLWTVYYVCWAQSSANQITADTANLIAFPEHPGQRDRLDANPPARREINLSEGWTARNRKPHLKKKKVNYKHQNCK